MVNASVTTDFGVPQRLVSHLNGSQMTDDSSPELTANFQMRDFSLATFAWVGYNLTPTSGLRRTTGSLGSGCQTAVYITALA